LKAQHEAEKEDFNSNARRVENGLKIMLDQSKSLPAAIEKERELRF